MKKFLLIVSVIVAFGSLIAKSQTTDLFISEYIDGSSGAQAIELFNGTGAPVNLKGYSLKISSSGAGWAWNTSLVPAGIDSLYILPLGNITLANDSVYVICNNATTRPGFRPNADIFLDATLTKAGSKLISYNGNDAIGLFKNNVLIDAVGTELVTVSPAPDLNVAGVIDAGADHTLIRKATVRKGNTNWTASAGTNAENSEWIVKDKNDASNLGYHLLSDLFISEYIDGSSGAQAIELFNGTGAPVNLKGYSLKMSSSGAGWAWNTSLTPPGIDSLYILPLGNISLAKDSVYVICNNATTRPGFRPNADIFLDATLTKAGSKLISYNGNDAIGLFNNNVLIDAVGTEKVTSSPAPDLNVAGVTGAGADHTLIRKSTVRKGNTDWAKSAGTTAENSEWVVKDKNDASNLGYHIESVKADVLTFTLPQQAQNAIIDVIAHTITIKVTSGTLFTALIPTITVSDKATVSPATGIATDFSAPVIYTVTAQAKNKQTWTVTVTEATDLFISEYIDGSSGAQAIEIFNGTGAPVNLKNYSLKMSSSGAGWAMNTSLVPPAVDSLYILPLGNFTLANDSVYVICNNATTRPGFRPNADIFLDATLTKVGSKLISYNGNDAIGLFKNNVLIDAVGAELVTTLPAPDLNVAGVIGAGADHTLIRKATVRRGNTDWTKSAGTNAEDSEWIVKDKNDASNLGYHIESVKADILTFSISQQTQAAVIDPVLHTINLTVSGTSLATLVPAITVSDKASVSPATAIVTDFSKPVSYTVTAQAKNKQVWTVTVSYVTSISDNKSTDVKVFPNPFLDKLNITDLNSISKIKISNILGQIIYNNEAVGNGIQINTSNYRSGIYFITFLTDKGNKVSKKLIKK